MKKQVKKMALSRETLRALEQPELAVIAGGREPSVDEVCTRTICQSSASHTRYC
jgi:hypothetical protein